MNAGTYTDDELRDFIKRGDEFRPGHTRADLASALLATLRQPAARVDDAMVERACTAYVCAGNHDDDDEVVSYVPARMRAALEAAPSAQPAPEFDVRKYVRHLADVLEAGVGLLNVDADLARLGAAIQAAAPSAPQGTQQGEGE